MRTAYQVLAYLIAAAVVVQAATIALAVFGLSAWVQNGGTLDKASMDTADFVGESGFRLHGMGGLMVVPALALLLLVVSFFAKVPGGVKWAAYVFGAVVLQVLLALASNGLPAVGLLHGANALLLFWVAWVAARRVGRGDPADRARRSDQVGSAVS